MKEVWGALVMLIVLMIWRFVYGSGGVGHGVGGELW